MKLYDTPITPSPLTPSKGYSECHLHWLLHYSNLASSSSFSSHVWGQACGHQQRSLGNWQSHRRGAAESKTPVPGWLNLIPLPRMQANRSRIYIVLWAGSINIDPPFPVFGVNEAFSIPTALWRTYVKPPLPLSMPVPPTHKDTHTQ